MDLLLAQLAALTAEVSELRRENEALRRERDAALGRRVHEPYAGGPVGIISSPSAGTAGRSAEAAAGGLAVAAGGSAAVVAASLPVMAGDAVAPMMRSGTPPRAAVGDVVMDLNSPPPKQDLKRAKPASEELEADA